MYDLLIRHGRIIDGTGSAPYAADVGVKDGDIVAIGRLEDEAGKTVDATGQVVAPGFID
jgi:N-acyl-D-amino-acid deacylase